MPKFSGRLTDTKAQGESIVHAGLCKVKIAAPVELIHELLVELIASAVTKTNQIQRRFHGKLKVIVLFNPASKLLGQFDMAPDMMLQTLNSIVTDDEPKLQRSEAPP